MTDKKPINVKIGSHVKHEREAAGLTQEAFAELLGLGDKHVSAIERGAVGVSLPTLIRICEVLSVPADVLLFGWPDQNAENDRASEIQSITTRLSRLPEREFRAAKGIMDRVFELLSVHR